MVDLVRHIAKEKIPKQQKNCQEILAATGNFPPFIQFRQNVHWGILSSKTIWCGFDVLRIFLPHHDFLQKLKKNRWVVRTSAKRLAYKSLWENGCLSPYYYIVICGVWLRTHTITTTANIFLLCSKEGEKKPLKCICVHHCLQMKDGLGAKKSSNKEKKRLRHKKSNLDANKAFPQSYERSLPHFSPIN